jgi:hypothetical protein
VITQRNFVNTVMKLVFQFFYKLRNHYLYKHGVKNGIHFEVNRLRSREVNLLICGRCQVSVCIIFLIW